MEILICFLFVLGGRAEETEARGTFGNDQKQCPAEVCHEEKSE